MNAIAPCTLSDEGEPLAQQMRRLTDLVDYAMEMARMAVQQYEALVRPSAEAAATPHRRQPDPGLLFIRAARIVQTCIFGQSRLAAGLPAARPARPRASVPENASPLCVADKPVAEQPAAEPPSAEPVRVALQTVTRNHPHGKRLLSASLDHLGAALASDPRRAADLPDLFLRVCEQSGIHLEPSMWRKAARILAGQIRASPA